MHTVVVISTRGFGVFRHDLVVHPERYRFVGIFTEQDAVNVTDVYRGYFDRIETVPCELPDPTTSESSLVDLAAARAVLADVVREADGGRVSVHSFDERNLLAAAELRADFDLPGPSYDEILPYRDKGLMKERLARTGLRVPVFGRVDADALDADRVAYHRRIVEHVGLPYILKPLSAAAADGVYKIESLADLLAVPDDLGKPYEYEEFILGTMFSVNLVSRDQRTVFGGVTEYLVNSTDVQQGRVNADINLIDTDPRVAPMVEFTETVLSALGWLDGACHLELFRTKEGELVFLEVGARFKGLAGLAAMQRNYGVALLNLAFEIEAGIESRPWDEEQVYCFDGVIPKRHGVVQELHEPELESDVSVTWKVRVGEEIGQGTSLIDNGGTFLVSNADYEACYRDFERLAGYRPITYATA